MNKYRNLDNIVFFILGKIADAFILNVLWIIACLPVVTIGAATAAFYHTMDEVILKDSGYLWREFWKAFRRDFKQATVLWLIEGGILGFAGLDIYLLSRLSANGQNYAFIGYFIGIFLLFLLMITRYMFPYVATFYNKTFAVIKNITLMACAHIMWSLLLLLILLICLGVLYFFPMALFFIPAGYMCLIVLILQRIFKRYMISEEKQEG